MSFRYAGGLITAGSPVNANYPSGVWTNQQSMPYINGQVWTQDQYFENTTLLLHGDGNPNGTNPSSFLTFKDNSTNNFPITVNGDAYGDNFGPYAVADGYWSNYFDGTGDWLTVTDNAAFDFGSGAFTIEGWFNPSVLLNAVILDNRYGAVSPFPGYLISPRLDGTIQVLSENITLLVGTITTPINQWSHFAVVRDGSSNLSLFINGVRDVTTTSSTVFNSAGNPVIGAKSLSQSGLVPINGYLSNFRMVNGSAVYDPTQSTLTVPTAPLTAISGTALLTCQSNRFVDNSTNNFAITASGDVKVQVFNTFGVLPDGVNGSGYFDGTGDYIQVADNAALELGSESNWTVEFWGYFVSTPSDFDVIIGKGTGSGSYEYFFEAFADRTIDILYSANGTTTWTGQHQLTPVIPLGTWFHFAAVRNGATFKSYVNGTEYFSGSSFNIYAGSGVLNIGGYSGSSTQDPNMYLSNVRIVKGTAVYTSNFTPPTSALTAVTNTSLLTCQYAGSVRNVGFIDSGPYDFPITRVGNTTQGTFSPFSKPDGRWGNYFGSSTANLKFASNAAFAIGTGNFTVECFVNFTEWAGTFQRIFIQGVSGTTNVSLGRESGGTALNVDINTSNVISYTWTPVLGRWYHIAVVRSGTGSGQVALYIDGVSVATGTSSASVGQNQFIVGGLDWASSYNIRGYISNFRYSNTARTITVPTAPYSSDGNTLILTCQSNRFIDNSSNAFAITRNGDVKVTPFAPFQPLTAYSPAVSGGAGYFDGTGDYLSATLTGATSGTGAFTYECWIYPDLSQQFGIMNTRSGNTTDGFDWSVAPNGTSSCSYTSLGFLASAAGAVKANAWSHMAVVYNGSGGWTLYINGVSSATYTMSPNFTSTTFNIGVSALAGNPAKGYISNFRYTGSAVYTTGFTPPTAPVVPIANTRLLCNFTNAGIFDNTGFNALETVGNAQVDTSVVKYGIGSMEFDGTGDWLLIKNNDSLIFRTGDFTVEGWFYGTSSTAGMALFSIGRFDAGIMMRINAHASNDSLYINNTAYNWNPASNFLLNRWNHVALVRSGSNLYVFVNGTSVLSTTNSADINQTTDTYIGAQTHSTSTTPFIGYADDFRITKGIARYTSNFTPPIARMPNQ
jgi:hypothetical protein